MRSDSIAELSVSPGSQHSSLNIHGGHWPYTASSYSVVFIQCRQVTMHYYIRTGFSAAVFRRRYVLFAVVCGVCVLYDPCVRWAHYDILWFIFSRPFQCYSLLEVACTESCLRRATFFATFSTPARYALVFEPLKPLFQFCEDRQICIVYGVCHWTHTHCTHLLS